MPGEQTPVEEQLRNMYGAALAMLLRLGVCRVTNKSSAERSRKLSRPPPINGGRTCKRGHFCNASIFHTVYLQVRNPHPR